MKEEDRQSLLAHYDVTESRGFLPAEDPGDKLSPGLKEWAEIASHLPKLLISNRLRQAVDAMPVITLENLRAGRDLGKSDARLLVHRARLHLANLLATECIAGEPLRAMV